MRERDRDRQTDRQTDRVVSDFIILSFQLGKDAIHKHTITFQ